MRPRFVPLFVILLCPAFAAAQVTQLWVARYHGPVPVSNDSAGFIAVDNNTDQVYVAGASQGTGGSEYALVSYDPCGNQLWVARNAGSVGGLAVDSNLGRVYVSSSAGIVAYDSDGNQLWIASYSAGNGGRIAVGGDTGNVYMIGVGPVRAAAVIAFDSDGNQLWTALFAPGRLSNNFADIAVDNISGNVYVTGTWRTPPIECMAEVAYNNIGTQLWTAGACGGGFVPINVGIAITVDSNGNIYATGMHHNDFVPNVWEYQTFAFDPTGHGLWDAFYSPALSGPRPPAGIATDNVNGNVYVTGNWGTVAYDSAGHQRWTNSFTAIGLTVDSTTGNVYVINTVPATGTGSDYDTVAYDSTGAQLWMAHYHGPVAGGSDYVAAIALDSNVGNVYVTGTSQATATSSDFATVAYPQASNTIPAVTTATPRIIHPTRRKGNPECAGCGCQLR